MIKNNKVLYSLLLLLLLGSIVYWRWISFTIFTGGDWPYYFPETFSSFPFTFTWFNLNDMGVANIIAWRSILASGQSVFAVFGLGSNVSDKILIFWPTIITANIFSFLLVKKIVKSNIGAIVGAIVFNYSTYYITASSAFLLYSAAPWVLLSLLLFIKALETNKKYIQVFSGLALFLAASYDFRVAYIGVFLLFAYCLYHLFFIENLGISVAFIKRLLSSSIVFFFFGLLNIYWILPMIKLGSLTDNSVLSRGLFGNEFLNVLYAIALYHPFWTGGKSTWFIVQPIMSYFWFIPVLAFLGLYLNRKNKNILFFGFITLLGIFLTKQIAHPFSNIYPWLNTHLIGFSAFREASKFYFLIVLGYSVLIGSFTTYLFNNYKKGSIYLKYLSVVLISLLFLWNTKSIITGDISGVFVPRHIPNDYIITNNLIFKDPTYYRTLWIPTISTWNAYTSNHPELNMGAMLNVYDYWARNTDTPESYGKRMIRVLNLPFSNNLLDISSVKYILIPLKDSENDGDFFSNFSEERQFYINQLSKINWLKKINIGTKEVLVYLNENFRPYIYATQQQETIKQLSPIIYSVKYQIINPTELRFTVSNVKKSFYLNLSENYNPQWNLRIGEFNWVDVILRHDYFIATNYHKKNDAGLNSYYIDLNEICTAETCKINKDGSYNILGTLYFSPQSYMYLGTIISSLSLLIILGPSLLMLRKEFYEKRNK